MHQHSHLLSDPCDSADSASELLDSGAEFAASASEAGLAVNSATSTTAFGGMSACLSRYCRI